MRQCPAKSHLNLLRTEGVFADGCEISRAGCIGTVCDTEVWRSFGSVLFRFIWKKQQHTLQISSSSTQNTLQLRSLSVSDSGDLRPGAGVDGVSLYDGYRPTRPPYASLSESKVCEGERQRGRDMEMPHSHCDR